LCSITGTSAAISAPSDVARYPTAIAKLMVDVIVPRAETAP